MRAVEAHQKVNADHLKRNAYLSGSPRSGKLLKTPRAQNVNTISGSTLWHWAGP